MKVETLARPCLRSVEPYLPGKPIAEVQRELGLRKVVKLASNENPLGASPKAMAELRRAVKDTGLYPEGASPLLRRALAAHHGVGVGQVIVGSGSDEVIRLLCEALLGPEDEVVCSRHGFIRFKQQAMMMGAGVVETPMRGFTHDLEAMARAVTPRTKMVYVASPNNPTGTYSTAAELSALLAALPAQCVLVLDEAYVEYARTAPGYPDTVPAFTAKHPNLFALRTFSKAYGLAGLRVGYGVGDAAVVSLLDRIRMPFNVALPSQRAALAALGDAAFLRRGVSQNQKSRAELARRLEALGLRCGPSATNFLFCASPLPGRELFSRLLKRGVIVRPLDEYGLPGHVRISVGTPSQNAFLLAALKGALKG
ncbi:histidinol-phosphate transaminase, partial [bacterium]